MLFSENPKPKEDAFQALMKRTDQILNDDAKRRPEYYKARGGNPLEDDVKEALDEAAIHTEFQGTVIKVSGFKFPDIVLSDGQHYGVEVKSTKHGWSSIGSSILESTRIPSVDRIFLTFGKLEYPNIEFKSKPYQECLSGVVASHYPRYLLDMTLKEGETIFDKAEVSYDELRMMSNPARRIGEYYKKKVLKEGDSLWWLSDNGEESTTTGVIRMWSNLEPEEKSRLLAYAYVMFPEVMSGGYNRYALWLVKEKGIVDSCIRDKFSAGGVKPIRLKTGEIKNYPAVFKRLQDKKDEILSIMSYDQENQVKLSKEATRMRLLSWCRVVAERAGRIERNKQDTSDFMMALKSIFDLD